MSRLFSLHTLVGEQCGSDLEFDNCIFSIGIILSQNLKNDGICSNRENTVKGNYKCKELNIFTESFLKTL